MYSLIPLAVLLAVPFIIKGTENCNNPFPDVFTTSGLGHLPKESKMGVQVIVPNLVFDCYGHIANWEMMVTVINTQPHIMHFQIWRPSGEGLFTWINAVPITEQLNNEMSLSQDGDAGNQIEFQPGDVFGFFMPKIGGDGTFPSFRQYYSTNFTTGPNNTLYYMNVDGSYPPCVVSLCDPGTQILSGVQLQIIPTIVSDNMSYPVPTGSDRLCDDPMEKNVVPQECVTTSSVTPTISSMPTVLCEEDIECDEPPQATAIIASAATAVLALLLVVVSTIVVTAVLCRSGSKWTWKRKGQAVHDAVEHYYAENGTLYAIPSNKSNSSLYSIPPDEVLHAESPDGMGPIATTTLSRNISVAAPYSNPVQTGVVAISHQPINTSDRGRSVSVSVIRNRPNMLASSSSAVPYMDPVSVARRATLPSRPRMLHSFQPQRPSSSKAHSTPSMVGSSVELTNSCGGMLVAARKEVMPYALSSITTLNTHAEECADAPGICTEPTSMGLDHGTSVAAFPYCEPSRFMLDRIPLENSPGFPYAELNSSSTKFQSSQTQVGMPYQDPINSLNTNRPTVKQQSLEPLPNPYMEPSPTIRPKHKHSIQEDQSLTVGSVPVHSPQEASKTQKNLNTDFKPEKQHSLECPNPYMEPSPINKTKRMHAISESQTPGINSSFIYIPPEEVSRMRETSVADDEVLHVPGFELRKHLQEEEIYSKLARSQGPGFFEQRDMFWEPQNSAAELYDQLAEHKYREIHRKQIGISNCIGSGHFGTVHRGVWQLSGSKIEVAVKTLRPNVSEKEKVNFLREAAIMGQFLHPNVIKLHGVVTVGEPLMIVLELMPKGDLKCFVKQQKRRMPDVNHLELSRLFVKFCRQIACGMNYLAKKEFIHRDLAARNIFLTDDLICKIGDFGMARDISNDDIYESQGGMIPLKWTAPEAVNYRQFSSDSDMWSYGMVLYEMWSLGHKPFEGMENKEIVSLVSTGHCQPPPPGCPRNMYKLMVQCWHPDPKSRPTFPKVIEYLNVEDEILLKWNSKDAETSSMVTELGAPLSEGLQLYLDLQKSYNILSPK